MGFCLLTTSGTWDPTQYGIQANTMLHIKCVGGGGGGSFWASGGSVSYNGSDGETTSFGSIISSEGGYGGYMEATNAIRLPKAYSRSSYKNMGNAAVALCGLNIISGGVGADGWMPGYTPRASVNGGYYLIPVLTNATTSGASFYSGILGSLGCVGRGSATWHLEGRDISMSLNSGTVNTTPTSNSLPFGYAGYIGSVASILLLSAGGVGYGAGGGGCCNSNAASNYSDGGDSGQIKDIDYYLTSTSPISYTIGAGGSGYDRYGGGGAQGCIAIWW